MAADPSGGDQDPLSKAKHTLAKTDDVVDTVADKIPDEATAQAIKESYANVRDAVFDNILQYLGQFDEYIGQMGQIVVALVLGATAATGKEKPLDKLHQMEQVILH